MAGDAGQPYLRAYMLEDMFTTGATEPGPAVMDSALWSQLPEDVLHKILLVLPRRSQVRFRAVSKSWRSHLTSAKFQARSAALAFYSGRFMCGLAHRDGYPVAGEQEEIPCLARYKVHNISLAFLPPDFQNLIHSRIRRVHWLRNSDMKRMATPLHLHVENGLLVLGIRTSRRTSASGQYKLCVVNLVNETWKELVVPPCSEGAFETDVVNVCPFKDRAGGRYFKLLIGPCMDPVLSGRLLYCSKTDAWTKTDDFCLPLDSHLGEKKNTTWDTTDPNFFLHHLPYFQFAGVEVDGTLALQIRCREVIRWGDVHTPALDRVFVVPTDLETQGFVEFDYMYRHQQWKCISGSMLRFGGVIVTVVYLDRGLIQVDVYLAYSIPLRSWKLLHAYENRTYPPLRHEFFQPESSVRL